MPRPTRPIARANPARSLLAKLTDSPALPVFIRSLPAPTLSRLIDHVGIADAGELIALTSAEQMRELFELSLWENLAPGQQEVLRSDRFLDWVDVLLDVSPAFAVERLIELGETFLTLQLDPLLNVIALSTAMPHRDDEPCYCTYCELIARGECAGLFGEYMVSAVHDDEWDAVHALLTELDNADAGLLERVLARCCQVPTALGFLDDGRPLLADEAHAREDRRTQKGFVTPLLAAAFLNAARDTAPAETIESDGYDAISRRYFERLSAARETFEDRAVAADTEDDAPSPTVRRTQLNALHAALVDAEVVADTGQKLLSGPQSSQEPTLELKEQLDRLQQTDPAAFSRRLSELVFLANVLVAGSRYLGGRFTEEEAAHAALACANLGVDYAVDRGLLDGSRAEAVESLLVAEAGLIRAFQAGWRLLQQQPGRAANALLEVLEAPHVRAQLAHKRWILDEVDLALHEPDLLKLIERGEFEDVGDNLVLLRLVLDPQACECLRALIADVPRFPLQLNVGFHSGHRAATASRSISSMRDLDRIEAFLEELDDLIKP